MGLAWDGCSCLVLILMMICRMIRTSACRLGEARSSGECWTNTHTLNTATIGQRVGGSGAKHARHVSRHVLHPTTLVLLD